MGERGFARLFIEVVQGPPPTMQAGQSSSVTLRVVGTEQSVPIRFEADTSVITLAGGAGVMTVSSTGGADNTVRIPVTAVRTGGYTINYTLVGEEGD